MLLLLELRRCQWRIHHAQTDGSRTSWHLLVLLRKGTEWHHVRGSSIIRHCISGGYSERSVTRYGLKVALMVQCSISLVTMVTVCHGSIFVQAQRSQGAGNWVGRIFIQRTWHARARVHCWVACVHWIGSVMIGSLLCDIEIGRAKAHKRRNGGWWHGSSTRASNSVHRCIGIVAMRRGWCVWQSRASCARHWLWERFAVQGLSMSNLICKRFVYSYLWFKLLFVLAFGKHLRLVGISDTHEKSIFQKERSTGKKRKGKERKEEKKRK